MVTITDLLPWFSMILAVAGIISTFAVMKYRLGQVEKLRTEDKQDFKEQLQAVQLSKHSKFKELKEDYNGQIQVCHKRISDVKDDVKESNKALEGKVEALGGKIDAANQALLNHVTQLIKGKNEI